MIEFLTGILLGSLVVFFIYECKKWQRYYIDNKQPIKKTKESVQLDNMMNYDGSIRGQKEFEN